MKNIKSHSVIAATSTEESFAEALLSPVEIIFDLAPDIMTLKEKIDAAHKHQKKLFIHFDLATGIGKDKSGILFVKSIGIDGIISTRVNIIKLAREEGLFTVQRFFILDSHSIQTTCDSFHSSKPDMIEILPGVRPKAIHRIRVLLNVPIIAGGLVEYREELNTAFESGATAVSTSNRLLWK